MRSTARLLAALVVLVTIAGTSFAQRDLASTYSYAASTPWPTRIGRGYFPVWVTVENESGRELRTEIEVISDGYRSPTRMATTEISLNAGEARTVEMIVPAFASSARAFSSDYRVLIHAKNRTNVVDDLDVNSSRWSREYRSVLWVSPDRLEPSAQGLLLSALDREEETESVSVHTTPGAMPRVTRTMKKNSVLSMGFATIAELSSFYEAYSSLDALVFDVGEELPSDEKLVPIMRWVRAGGFLAVVGDVAANKVVLGGAPEFAEWLQERFLIEGEDAQYRAGLGVVALFPAPIAVEPERLSAGALHSVLWSEFPRDYSSVPTNRLQEPMIEIPGVDRLPLRLMMIALFIFAMIIGPANLMVVKKLGRPGLLLVTVPALSLLASALLLSYGILYQGIDVKTASHSLTVLDQRDHRSVTVERRTLFAGLSPGPGLKPGAGTVVFPEQPSDGTERYAVEQGAGLLLRSSYLPVRDPVSQILITERANRNRLGLVHEAGDMSVTNTLGTTLERLVVCDVEGNWYLARDAVSSGSSAQLEPIAADELEEALEQFGEACPLTRGRWISNGSYLALLADPLFTDDCGVELNELASSHALIGVLGASAEDWR